MEPYYRIVVRKTWLSNPPDIWAFMVAALATLSLFFTSLAYWHMPEVQSMLAASGESVFSQHQIYRLWTTLFVHADEKHLLSNSLLFFILGGYLSGTFGFLLFPLAAFAFGGITNFFIVQSMPSQVQLIGASGIVFWMGGVWLALYFLIDVRRSYYQRMLRVIGVGLVLFFPAEAFDPQISYQTHLLGFTFGLAYGVFHYLVNKKKYDQAVEREVVIDEDPVLDPTGSLWIR